MSYPDPEADFHSRLYVRLLDYLEANPDAPFADVGIEEDAAGGRADIYLSSHDIGDLVIEVKRADVDPRSPTVVKQARDYADSTGASLFATCNARDFFLYDYRGEDAREIDFHYRNLRDDSLGDAIPDIFATATHLSRRDRLPQQHERERIVGVLRSFHSAVWPTFKYLAAQVHGDETFTDHFDQWVRENDYVEMDTHEQLEIAAKQYAYLLTNRVLFYQVVREQTPHTIPTESGDLLDSLVGGRAFEDHLTEQFTEIIEEVDYGPIFMPDTGLFEVFPHNTKTRGAIADLVRNIESRSLTAIDEDLLGEIYEELIPADERKLLGQYYTHPKIAETIVRWALPESDDYERTDDTDSLPRVLDPASGSGTFTVEAYKRLASLLPEATHQDVLDHLVAVDINRFPLHLTSLNLASRNIRERTDRIHAYHTSFFTLDPGTSPLVPTRLSGGSTATDGLGTFDAVVGNPPYIRQENLYPDKTHFRSSLKRYGRSNHTTYDDGSKKLSTKSDAYVYFVTHATQFLREAGRLGFIVPTKWMMADYGRSFQRFLFDHYRLEAVVGFSARAFDEALVDTALLLLERCSDPDERADTTTKFVRLNQSMEVEHIVDVVTADVTVPPDDDMVVETRPNYRTVAMAQRDVADTDSGKLGHFLAVPQDIIRLVEHPQLCSLEDFADVSYGNKTGANPFFFLDEGDLAEWPIHRRFLTPAIKSIRDTDSQVVTGNTTDRYLLDVHDYVEEVEASSTFGDGSSLTERVKRTLERDGYDTLRAYVEFGEREGYQERPTCASRPVWFDLGNLLRPAILHPKFFDDRVIPMWNRDRLAPSNAVDGIYLDDGVDEELVMAVLNSTVHKVILECWGRAEGGGALQLMTYEMESLPTIDPATISGARRNELVDALHRLLDGDPDAQADLDAALLETLHVDLGVEALQEMRETIAKRRTRSGEDVEVPMARLDELDDVGVQSFRRKGGDDETTLGEFADG
ncbi:MAG: N-6 DNA methylase [Halovenus sp.]